MAIKFSRRTAWIAVQSTFYLALASVSAYAQQSEPAKKATDEKTDKVEAVEKIVVSGSRLPASIQSMPQSVQLIDSEEIARQIAVSPNLSDILANLVPGISRGTNTSVNTYTAVRGRKPVFLVDGAPITSTLNDTARELALIDPTIIERIEVVPGSSALYGNSAGAGFINYVTKTGDRGPLNMRTEFGSEMSTTKFAGSGSRPSLRQSFSGTLGQFDYRVTGLYERINDFYDADGNVIPPQLGSAVQNSTVKSTFAKLGHNFGRQRVEGSVNYYSQTADIDWAVKNGNISLGIPASAVPAISQPGQIPEEHESLVANVNYSNSAVFGSTSSFRAQGYYVDTTSWFQYAANRFPLFPEAPNGQSGNITKKSGARFDINTPLRALMPMDGSVLWGLDLMRDNTKIPLVDGRQFGIPQTLTSTAGFIQLQFSPFENWKVSAGVRRESSSLEVTNYLSIFTKARITGGTLKFDTTPVNAGAVYSLSKMVDLYAGFSQGFDIQQTSQNFRAWPVDLDLTKAKPPANVIDSYEAGVRFRGDETKASIGVYKLTSSNGISYVFTATDPSNPRAIIAPDEVTGVEVVFDYTGIENWTIGGSYARNTGKADSNNDGTLDTPLQNRRIPPPSVTGHVEYEISPGSYVRVQGLFSGTRNAFPNTVPGRFHEGKVNSFRTVDVTAKFNLAKNADLVLGVRNLFNADYFTNYSEGFNTNDNYLKAAGRTVSVRLAFTY